jgi:HrpA-like RNA helicase
MPPQLESGGTSSSADGSSIAPVSRISAKNKQRILDSVLNNRVTIVVGATGSGKSTLVPPLLLDHLPFQKPVLCSQPRRLAVVAIAKRVAEMRGEGEKGATKNEVSYHVGNQNLSTKHTRLLFTTAGILLEELRANGVDTLTRFGCIIIDECHERSPESDLVMALCKQFMRSHPREPVRLVLMSASFDSERYKAFFIGSICPSIDIIPLETAQAFDAYHTQVKEYYLEDIIRRLPQSDVVQSIVRPLLKDPSKDLAMTGGKELSTQILFLIVMLVEWLHAREDLQAPFLIFAPTYKHLEQIHTNLEQIPDLQLHVLHSSVDMEECLRSMMPGLYTHRRRVLLASAIADSSITVPGVSCVIDMCRALEVKWRPDTKSYIPNTIWASQSICQQRRGRTGRTCPGSVFRLIPKGFYVESLQRWDVPQLTLSSCHNEVLSIVTSKSKVDARRLLLDACMDKPDPLIVDDAIEYLKKMGAITLTKNNKFIPSKYGSLLAVLPLDVRDSTIVLAGAQMGLLYEALALRAIVNHKPSPIIHYFGDRNRNEFNMTRYYPEVSSEDATSAALAHLAAYMFWDVEWNCTIRLNRARQLFDYSSAMVNTNEASVWEWTDALEEEHLEWCRQHEINPTAVRSISELIESTVHVFYKSQFEPEWLRCSDTTPQWKDRRLWKGATSMGGWDMFKKVYSQPEVLTETLFNLCQNQFNKSIRGVFEMKGLSPPDYVARHKKRDESPIACIHFLAGKCQYGYACRHVHSFEARRPPCRFFNQGKCTKGRSCLYSHQESDEDFPGITLGGSTAMKALVPTIPEVFLVGGAVAWFKENHRKLMMLGEGDFKFTTSLTNISCRPARASTNARLAVQLRDRGFWERVDATKLHMDLKIIQALSEIKCFAWNFPLRPGSDEDPTANERMLLDAFISLSTLLKKGAAFVGEKAELSFAVTLQGDQFARWSILRSAWRTGWWLDGWCEFIRDDFPGYEPSRHHGESFAVESPRFYVFKTAL